MRLNPVTCVSNTAKGLISAAATLREVHAAIASKWLAISAIELEKAQLLLATLCDENCPKNIAQNIANDKNNGACADKCTTVHTCGEKCTPFSCLLWNFFIENSESETTFMTNPNVFSADKRYKISFFRH